MASLLVSADKCNCKFESTITPVHLSTIFTCAAFIHKLVQLCLSLLYSPPTLQSALNWISKCSDIVTTTLPQQRFSLACFKKCNKAWNQCQSAEQIVLLLTKGLLKEVILRGTKSKYAAAFMCPLSPVQEIRVFFFPAISPSMCVKRAAALPRFKKVKVSDKRSLYYWLCWEIITLEGFATLHAHDNCTHNNMIDHSNIGTHKKTFFFFYLKLQYRLLLLYASSNQVFCGIHLSLK